MFVFKYLFYVRCTFQDTLYDGSISRDQVADVAVEAMLNPEASSYKVVEVVSGTNAPKYSLKDLFNEI